MFSSHFVRNTVAHKVSDHALSWSICSAVTLIIVGAAQDASGFQQNAMTTESEFNVVFVNGEYIESPYVIQHEDDSVWLNGHRLQVSEASLIEQSGREGRNRGGGRRGPWSPPGMGRTPNSLAFRFARELNDQLQNMGMLIIFEGYPVRSIPINGQGLSEILAAGESVTKQQFEELNLTETKSEADVWMNWLSKAAISSEAQLRIQTISDHVATSEEKYRSEVEQLALLEQFAYPLTVMGMLLGVIALGYMLQWAGNGLNQVEPTAESERYVLIALWMMAGMAIVDFTWTVLAGQAGQMTEVNPLAAYLIHSPSQLAIFKVLAAGVGFGILYFWRQRQQIRQATWWMCLVSVLLTFRWVMFDSMRI